MSVETGVKKKEKGARFPRKWKVRGNQKWNKWGREGHPSQEKKRFSPYGVTQLLCLVVYLPKTGITLALHCMRCSLFGVPTNGSTSELKPTSCFSFLGRVLYLSSSCWNSISSPVNRYYHFFLLNSSFSKLSFVRAFLVIILFGEWKSRLESSKVRACP